MWTRTKFSRDPLPFRRNALAGALALALLEGAAQAAPLDPLGPPDKLNVGPPEAVQAVDVELNNPGAGVALWQELRSDGRYATYFRRFDRYGQLAARQTHAVTDTLFRTQVLKVFDSGAFAVATRQGDLLKIKIRDKNGAVLRNLRDIPCAIGCNVAMDDEGELVVVQLKDDRVQARLLDAGGNVVKPWFIVDQPVQDADSLLFRVGPAVAVDADGDFAVGWGFYYTYSEVSSFVRLFSKTGQPKGGPIDAGAAASMELAMDADGDFVLSFTGSFNNTGGLARPGWSVYRKDGTRVTTASRDGTIPRVNRVVMDDDGDYAIVTDFPFDASGAQFGFELFQRFSQNSLGKRDLANFFSPPATGKESFGGDVAMDGKGHLAAIWHQAFEDEGFSDPLGLFLQRFVGPPGESCAGAGATIVGTPGRDNLYGTNRDDVIHGKGDHDVIHGRGGNDAICGGKGNDRLYGDAGRDRIYGELGFDELFGGDGNDYLNGGPDVDFADGGPGYDTCSAESVGNCP